MRLLEMSISAGVLIILLVLLRMLWLSKLPKRLFVLLWMVALIRLLLPVSLPLKNGIATPMFQLLQKGLHMLRNHMGANGQAASSAMQETISSVCSGSTEKGIGTALLSGKILLVIYGIWITGMVGFGIYFTYSFLKEYHMLAQAIPLQQKTSEEMELMESLETAQRLVGGQKKHRKKGQLLIHDQIYTPLVWGITRQQIVFPKSLKDMDSMQIQYMLTHEMVHIRRRDNLWKLLSAAVVCIHWFNPMAWVMYILLARDLELSCDEQVLALYGSKSREEYAMTLLALVQNQNGRTLFCSGFEKNPTKERIVAIMKYKNLTRAGIFSAVLLLAGAATVFAANDKAAASEGMPQEQVDVVVSHDKEVDHADEPGTKAGDEESDLNTYELVVETNKDKEVDHADEPRTKAGDEESDLVTYELVVETNEDSEIDNEDKIVFQLAGEIEGEGYYLISEQGESEDETVAVSVQENGSADDTSIVSVDSKKYAVKKVSFVTVDGEPEQ